MSKKSPSYNVDTINSIILRAHYLANKMIYMANHREDKAKGDPKVGGHSSASASAIHIMGALHLLVKSGFDHISNKPHASPADHAFNYLLDLMFNKDGSRMSLEDANIAMRNLRAFSKNGEPVFQSYHSALDPDNHNFLPTGTVGIPPVNAGYLALAYRYADSHNYKVPNAHFWSLIGDSEFREGSLFEATPDFAEREIGNLTWIVDYNRQSLDGHRISNPNIMHGSDDRRIRDTMEANGWEVLEARHGKKRQEFFQRPGGEEFQKWFENELTDYELQSLLNVKDPKVIKDFLADHHGKKIRNFDKFSKSMTDAELFELFRDFGGHDTNEVYETLKASKESKTTPTLIIAHTLKGWGLDMAAIAGNHSMLPDEDEMTRLRERVEIPASTPFARFEDGTNEAKFLKARQEALEKEMNEQYALKEKNQALFAEKVLEHGGIPDTLGVNFKMANFPHTQWMLGQLTAKLTRIANTPWEATKDKKQKDLDAFEKSWKTPAELMVSMAPDVGTSTNLNPAMDGKIFGAEVTEDIEEQLSVKDKKTPDLVPGQQDNDRFIRFEIVEGNTMSCMGSFGRLRDTLGIPIIPLMTVYDFFIKRALDQYFYNLYWKSSFILVGTPAGVTLSPEGAQHGWKSDFQIPNQIAWEPFYAQELDWILSESIKRHVNLDNEGRTGVLIRGVTRGIDQKGFMTNLKQQKRYKLNFEGLLSVNGYDMDGATNETQVESLSDEDIMSQVREDILQGAYYLKDYRDYAGYVPGDNVVNIFSLGSLTTEALIASDKLLEKGIYANVIVVTSTDLLIGGLGHENNYHHLKENLDIKPTLYVKPKQEVSQAELMTLSGQRVPIVSVHDGEPGLMDNIGSIIGVRHESLAVRKHSKCGRPEDVYKYHGIDADSVYEACEKVLSETALEQVVLRN